MGNTLDIFGIIALIGGSQGILIAFTMLHATQSDYPARRIHGVLSLCYALLTLSIAFSQLGIYSKFPSGILITISLLYLPGPLGLIYLKSLKGLYKQSMKTFPFHVTPFGVVILIAIYFSLYPNSRIENWFILPISMLGALHIIAYSIFSHRIKSRMTAQNKRVFSNLQNRDLRWVTNFQIFGVIIFSYMLGLTLLPIIGFMVEDDSFSIIAVFGTVAFIYNSYHAYQQEDISSDLQIAAEDSVKYKHSKLHDNEGGILAKKVVDALVEKELYLNPDLKLSTLAKAANIKCHTLSQVLNDVMGTSFYELVNKHRIENAKLELLAPENKNYTILAMALECGFNSKSVFNEAFKRYTGLTPSHFRSEKS